MYQWDRLQAPLALLRVCKRYAGTIPKIAYYLDFQDVLPGEIDIEYAKSIFEHNDRRSVEEIWVADGPPQYQKSEDAEGD